MGEGETGGCEEGQGGRWGRVRRGGQTGKPCRYSRAGSALLASVGCWVAMETRRTDRTRKREAWREDKLRRKIKGRGREVQQNEHTAAAAAGFTSRMQGKNVQQMLVGHRHPTSGHSGSLCGSRGIWLSLVCVCVWGGGKMETHRSFLWMAVAPSRACSDSSVVEPKYPAEIATVSKGHACQWPPRLHPKSTLASLWPSPNGCLRQ